MCSDRAADVDAVAQVGWDGTVSRDVRRLPDRYVSNVTDATVRRRA